MKVELISWTPTPERTIAIAAKQCYSGINADAISNKMDDESVGKFVSKLANTGHTPIEHAYFTFSIDGLSRAGMAQLTRHRIANFNVSSQRYINHANFEYVTPPSIAGNSGAKATYDALMEKLNETYKALQNMGVKNEDARFILPNACTTRIICTMNARSLMHFFNLRCCVRAQWEIRELANEMLRLVKQLAPNLFAKAGAHCEQYGVCVEENSCGKCKGILK